MRAGMIFQRFGAHIPRRATNAVTTVVTLGSLMGSAVLVGTVVGSAVIDSAGVASAHHTAASVDGSGEVTGDTTGDPAGDGADRLVPPMACPVVGENEFVDSWHAPRSGGRKHQGVDLIAAHGTPIVAAQSGSVWFKQSRLGGNSVWLTMSNGDQFFYAHLDRFEGESREVHRGEILGYVGSTGNAHGPHLHFEMHVGGGPVNPFAATSRACRRPAVSAFATWLLSRVDPPWTGLDVTPR